MAKKQETMGMTWLTFFGFVRPWITIILSILTLINIFGYEEYQYIYFETSIGIIAFISLIIGLVISLITFIKFKRKDANTPTFIKYILIYESISTAFSTVANQGHEDVGYLLFLWVIMSIITLLIWYRLNMKYFNKRLWYFDNKKIYKKEINDESTEDEDYSNERKEEIKKSSKYNGKFCKKCGGKLTVENQCSKCGHKYFKFNKNWIFYIIISVLVVSNITFILLYDDAKNEAENVTAACLSDENDSWCETTMDILTDGKSWSYTNEKLDFYDENIVFVVQGYDGYAYHYDCLDKYIEEDEYSFWAYNKEAAIDKGYKIISCD